MLIVIVLVIGSIAIVDSIGQINADNGNKKKRCDDHNHDSDSSGNCPQKDKTPFILPFP